MIYFPTARQSLTPEPKSILHKTQKDDKYYLEHDKYIYTDSSDVYNDISRKIEVLRSYASGKQDTSQYKTHLDDELKEDEMMPNSVYKRDEVLKQKRSGLSHINYEQVFNPMPVYIQKILGILEDSDYNLRCYAENENSNNERLTLRFRKQLLMDFPDVAEKLGTNEFVPKNMMELDAIETVGGFKLTHEVTCEKINAITSELSDEPQVARKVKKDLLEIGKAAVIPYYDNGFVKYRYIDYNNILIEYSTERGYENSRYWAYYEEMTIQELRQETGWDEQLIKRIADEAQKLYNNRLYKKENPDDISYYNSYRIPVIRNFWRSIETAKIQEKINKNGEFKRRDISFEKSEPVTTINRKVIKEDIPVIDQSSWIIGTDYTFSNGRFANTAFDFKDKRPLPPLIVYQMPIERSIVENSLEALDQIALIYYKFQNNMAIASPTTTFYDLKLLNNINFDGKDWSALDLVDLQIKTGKMFYEGTAAGMPNEQSTGGNKPFQLPSEAMAAINEAQAGFKMWFDNLSILTGLDQYTLFSKTPSSDTTATAINQGAASTSATLRPIIDGWTHIHKRLFYSTIYMIQGRILDDEECYERYSNMIGKEYMASLKAVVEKEPLMLGIKVIKNPNNEMKQMVLKAAEAAMQMQDGIAALTYGEYLYIVNELLNDSGINHARVIIMDREQKAQDKRQKASEAKIKLQSEGNMKLEEEKRKTMIIESGLKMKENYEKEKAKAFFAAELAEKTSANKILEMTTDKTIDAMLQGQILPPQGQVGGQPQGIPQPQMQ